MTRTRLVLALWLVVGVIVWNGFFDLYISRGARQYLQVRAEADLGRISPISMTDVMARAARDGVRAASAWVVLIVACGWLTVWFVGRRPRL